MQILVFPRIDLLVYYAVVLLIFYTNLVKQQLSAAAQQTKIRHTSPDKIKDCTVWLPELEEQKRIGKLLRTIDRKIELNRSILSSASAMRFCCSSVVGYFDSF